MAAALEWILGGISDGRSFSWSNFIFRFLDFETSAFSLVLFYSKDMRLTLVNVEQLLANAFWDFFSCHYEIIFANFWVFFFAFLKREMFMSLCFSVLHAACQDSLLVRGDAHLDWQVLPTEGDHDFDGWEGPAWLVGLYSGPHSVL